MTSNIKKYLVNLVAILTITVMLVACGSSEVSESEEFRVIKVSSFSGGNNIIRSEETMEAFEGMSLLSDDRVEVQESALLELLVDDDKHIAASESTIFRILATGNKDNGSVCIKLISGEALFTIDNKLSEGSTFEVKTPNASLSVRGTTFKVGYDPVIEATTVEVIEGTVEVKSAEETNMLTSDDNEIVIVGNADYTDDDFAEDETKVVIQDNELEDNQSVDIVIEEDIENDIENEENLDDVDIEEDNSEETIEEDAEEVESDNLVGQYSLVESESHVVIFDLNVAKASTFYLSYELIMPGGEYGSYLVSDGKELYTELDNVEDIILTEEMGCDVIHDHILLQPGTYKLYVPVMVAPGLKDTAQIKIKSDIPQAFEISKCGQEPLPIP